MLEAEPEFSLGNKGSNLPSTSMTTTASPPIAQNVVRQPSQSPTTRPKGIPITMASVVPVASMLSACAFLPTGAMRTASAAVIDQNTACDSATPMRLAMSISKLVTMPDAAWLTINSANTPMSSLRRSILRVSNINGSDAKATTQA
ncbi:hypothetical protein D3C72_1712330 [compost metagenome]